MSTCNRQWGQSASQQEMMQQLVPRPVEKKQRIRITLLLQLQSEVGENWATVFLGRPSLLFDIFNIDAILLGVLPNFWSPGANMLKKANFESYNSFASVESSQNTDVRMRIDLSIWRKNVHVCRIKDINWRIESWFTLKTWIFRKYGALIVLKVFSQKTLQKA